FNHVDDMIVELDDLNRYEVTLCGSLEHGPLEVARHSQHSVGQCEDLAYRAASYQISLLHIVEEVLPVGRQPKRDLLHGYLFKRRRRARRRSVPWTSARSRATAVRTRAGSPGSSGCELKVIARNPYPSRASA